MNKEMDTYWEVKLSDGTIIEQDDSQENSWVSLSNYLKDNQLLSIISFSIHFRDNQVILPSNKSRYYFAKGALQAMSGGDTVHYYVVGWLKQEGVMCMQWVKIPELIIINEFDRPLSECKPPCLISFLP